MPAPMMVRTSAKETIRKESGRWNAGHRSSAWTLDSSTAKPLKDGRMELKRDCLSFRAGEASGKSDSDPDIEGRASARRTRRTEHPAQQAVAIAIKKSGGRGATPLKRLTARKPVTIPLAANG